MQLTRFDRWLREKYAYETHIKTLRAPDEVPRNIKCIDLPDEPGRRYKHLFIANRTKDVDEFLNILRENSQMYETQIIEKNSLFVRIVAPKEKSLTWSIFSMIVIGSCVVFAFFYLKKLFSDPVLRQNMLEAFDILKS